jgi:para-nitrobenzyl esterase
MMHRFCLALFLMCFIAPPLICAQGKVVRIESGELQGVAEPGGVTAFKGIPYAAAPVGELRWRPPQPQARWEGVRKADHFCSPCGQPVTGNFGPYTKEFLIEGSPSEDCLFLNVWTAASSRSERRPVMVWIYGGGFSTGGAECAIYDGAELAKKGVVLVSINYRVGPLGFLAHPELTKESAHRTSGNYGLLDQVAALEWVQRNIKAFGGDPRRVTIFGQSAGAISVNLLTQSPLAKGLFARAIMQSGPGLLLASASISGTKLSMAEQAGVKYAESKGAPTLAQLRALPAKELMARGAPGTSGPITDGWFLPENSAHINEVPILIGMTADDITVGGSGPQQNSTVSAYQSDVQKTYGAKAEAFLKLYPATSDREVGELRKMSGRDRGRVSITLWATERMKQGSKVYTYFFSRAIPWPEHPEFGAFHTAEVPYVFNNLKTLDRPWEAGDRKLTEQMSSYWVNFAKAGNPNGKGLPLWVPVDKDSHTTMEFGLQVGPMPLATPEKLSFWQSFLAKP